MRIVLFLITVLAFGALGCRDPKAAASATPQELAQRGAPVVDVRTPREYEAGHLKGATNIPLDVLEQRIQAIAPDKNAPLLVHCQSGGRSAAATRQLQSLGYTKVVDLGSLANARKVVEGQ